MKKLLRGLPKVPSGKRHAGVNFTFFSSLKGSSLMSNPRWVVGSASLGTKSSFAHLHHPSTLHRAAGCLSSGFLPGDPGL